MLFNKEIDQGLTSIDFYATLVARVDNPDQLPDPYTGLSWDYPHPSFNLVEGSLDHYIEQLYRDFSSLR
ncbi:MAG: hypothetical protein PHU23_15455 [Dehalococcoidales bacterium]|nr:hypothetical protein [Dehalococcoidales bacterium]